MGTCRVKGWSGWGHREVTRKKPACVVRGLRICLPWKIKEESVEYGEYGVSPFWFDYEERLDPHTCKYRKILRPTHIKLVDYH